MTQVKRRQFLQTTSALSSALFVSPAIARRTSILDKLNIACIGTANRAGDDVQGVISQNIIALCDIDRSFLERSQKMVAEKLGNQPSGFADYREMIDQLGDRIDAVVVATADHHHAPATIRAIRAGKHVYCEKPLTHTVEEARIISEAAKEAGVATQMGTQIHAENNYRRVVEIVQSGALGDITDVHVWVAKVWGGGDRPTKTDVVPDSLSWDLWLGPAPERPYAAGIYHPANWRRFWDFGQGTLGDMACHFMDLPFWALDLRHPSTCRAEGADVHPETAPVGLKVFYEFPARGDRPALNLTWHDGNMIPKEINGQKVPGNGVMFVGTEGMMFADYDRYRLFPQEDFADFKPPAETIPPSVGHHQEWIDACLNGTPTLCNFDYSGALTESVLLGNAAYRSGESLQWNAAELKVTNTSKADQYISKEYRSGWEVTRQTQAAGV